MLLYSEDVLFLAALPVDLALALNTNRNSGTILLHVHVN